MIIPPAALTATPKTLSGPYATTATAAHSTSLMMPIPRLIPARERTSIYMWNTTVWIPNRIAQVTAQELHLAAIYIKHFKLPKYILH